MRRGLFAALLALVLFSVSVLSAFAQGGNVHYVQWGESLSSIAVLYGVTPEAIMEANGLQNPDFVYVGQKLIIPSSGHSSGYRRDYYTVQAGDTLGGIARKLNTTAQALATANNLGNVDVIYVGQVLNVPGGGGGSAGYAAPSYGACGQYYVVRWGDTLSGIAWKYGTTLNAILGANNLYSDAIYEGQKLCLPAGHAHLKQAARYHVVQAGDTVTGIAHRYGVSQAKIIQANNLSNAGFIYVGQKLIIPGYHPQASYEKPKKYEDKETVLPAPSYIAHDTPAEKRDCNYPLDVWVHQKSAVVEAVNTWCPRFDQVADPDGMTSIVVRTKGHQGAVVKIQRGNGEAVNVISGSSPGLGPDVVWYPISPGYYRVWVDAEEPSAVAEFDLAAGRRAWVDFFLTSVSENPRPRTSSGWSGQVTRNESQTTPNEGVSSVIIVRGPAQGLPIRIRAEGEFTAVCYTGQKPEYGPGVCEFGGLWPGKYTLTLEGSGAAVEVYVDGKETAEVTFDVQ